MPACSVRAGSLLELRCGSVQGAQISLGQKWCTRADNWPSASVRCFAPSPNDQLETLSAGDKH